MDAACVTCREVHLFGYGSRRCVIGFVNTLAELDAEMLRLGAKSPLDPGSRQAWIRAFVAKHDGHDITWWTDDGSWLTQKGDRMVVEGDYTGEILDVTGWPVFDHELDWRTFT